VKLREVDVKELRGVIAATVIPYLPDERAPAGLRVSVGRYEEHCRRLVRSGCSGVVVNSSMGGAVLSPRASGEWSPVRPCVPSTGRRTSSSVCTVEVATRWRNARTTRRRTARTR
jgi:hypothetical protein